MKYTIHGFNQIEIMKINQELGLQVKLKREPNWQPNTEDIIMKDGKTRKRPEPKLPKISNNELLILRWFVDFYGTGIMTKIDVNGSQYVWVKYQSILDDLPILDINKDGIKRVFDNLVDFKILKHQTIKNEFGTFAVYYFDENYERLVKEIKDNGCTLKSIDGYVENKVRVR